MVTTTSDVPVVNKLTLRQAITQANAAAAAGDNELQVINFSSLPANDWTINLLSQLPAIQCNISISGAVPIAVLDGDPPVDNRITINRGAPQDAFRLLEVKPTWSAAFGSLKLLNGVAGALQSGGAILSQGTSLVVNFCEIRQNNADGRGGGIAVEGVGATMGGTLEVNDSLIVNNGSEGLGGGIYFVGSSMSMCNSRVTGNTAAVGGGGVYLGRISSAENTVGLTAVEIDNNTTRGDIDGTLGYGGGIYCSVWSFTLVGGDIHDNDARKGGGIYLIATNATLRDVTLEDNKAQTGRGMYVSVVNANWTVGPGPGQVHLGGTPVDDIVNG